MWSFKRKLSPDVTLNKHKARLCAKIGMQQWGINYWETYAPVVNWTSVRLLMILAQLRDLDTKAIDFVLAFPQADLEIPVYMEIPVGMTIGNDPDSRKKYVLKLKKSLYGLKNASANWHQFLKKCL